jgi:hypothetical protein
MFEAKGHGVFHGCRMVGAVRLQVEHQLTRGGEGQTFSQ